MATSTLFQIATINPTATAVPTVIPAMFSTTSAPQEDEGTGECKLLGPFALIVQAALGALALLSLVYKRWRERPQRPLKIWAFDASKQVVGTALLHVANLLMSMFSAGQIPDMVTSAVSTVTTDTAYQPNPCSWYLLNLAIDTTIGIPILIILLKLLHAAFRLTPLARPPQSIQSGNYGSPPRYTWWVKQSIIYFLGLLGMKFCVFILFHIFPWIVKVGDWALRWTEGNEALQIAFVMLIFPLIMNAMQYYIIDIFIKNSQSSDQGNKEADDEAAGTGRDRSHSGSTSDGSEHRALLSSDHHDREHDSGEALEIDIEAEDKIRKKNPDVTTTYKGSSGSMHRRNEYDPDKDGEEEDDEEEDDLLDQVSKEPE